MLSEEELKKSKKMPNNTNTELPFALVDRARHLDSGYFFLLLFPSPYQFSFRVPRNKKGQPARQHIRRRTQIEKGKEMSESRKNKKKNPFMALPSDTLLKYSFFCTFAASACCLLFIQSIHLPEHTWCWPQTIKKRQQLPLMSPSQLILNLKTFRHVRIFLSIKFLTLAVRVLHLFNGILILYLFSAFFSHKPKMDLFGMIKSSAILKIFSYKVESVGCNNQSYC